MSWLLPWFLCSGGVWVFPEEYQLMRGHETDHAGGTVTVSICWTRHCSLTSHCLTSLTQSRLQRMLIFQFVWMDLSMINWKIERIVIKYSDKIHFSVWLPVHDVCAAVLFALFDDSCSKHSKIVRTRSFKLCSASSLVRPPEQKKFNNKRTNLLCIKGCSTTLLPEVISKRGTFSWPIFLVHFREDLNNRE